MRSSVGRNEANFGLKRIRALSLPRGREGLRRVKRAVSAGQERFLAFGLSQSCKIRRVDPKSLRRRFLSRGRLRWPVAGPEPETLPSSPPPRAPPRSRPARTRSRDPRRRRARPPVGVLRTSGDGSVLPPDVPTWRPGAGPAGLVSRKTGL